MGGLGLAIWLFSCFTSRSVTCLLPPLDDSYTHLDEFYVLTALQAIRLHRFPFPRRGNIATRARPATRNRHHVGSWHHGLPPDLRVLQLDWSSCGLYTSYKCQNWRRLEA